MRKHITTKIKRRRKRKKEGNDLKQQYETKKTRTFQYKSARLLRIKTFLFSLIRSFLSFELKVAVRKSYKITKAKTKLRKRDCLP